VESTENDTSDKIFAAISPPSGCGVCTKLGELVLIKKNRRREKNDRIRLLLIYMQMICKTVIILLI
jgi:hypothetical protein